MILGRADRRDDALADAGDDRFLGRPADELRQVRPHRHAGPHQQLDAVLGHGAQRRAARFLRVGAVDHLRIDARPHRVEHVAAGQVDRRRPVEVEVDVGPMRGDDRVDHARHVAAGQVMGLQPPRGDARVRIGADAGLHGHDLGFDDRPGVHLPQAHADQAQQAHAGVGHERLKPQLAVAEEHERQHKRGDQRHGHGGDEQQHADIGRYVVRHRGLRLRTRKRWSMRDAEWRLVAERPVRP